MNSSVTPCRMQGLGGAAGFSPGTLGSLGGGTGGAGGGAVPFFGLREAATGLVGEFYDLKQTKDLKPTDMAVTEEEKTTNMPVKGWSGAPESLKYRETLKHFVSSSWNAAALEKFYKAPNKLTTTQIFIPHTLAAEAPKAFGVDQNVSPRRWVVHYSGEVIPPKSGRFRFVGIGDDVLMVRINGRNVLDANWNGVRVLPELGTEEPGTDHLRGGVWFELHAGERVKMDALIGENPGGHCMAVLFIDEQAAKNPPGDYALFLLKDLPVADVLHGKKFANYTGKKLVFASPDSRSFFNHPLPGGPR